MLQSCDEETGSSRASALSSKSRQLLLRMSDILGHLKRFRKFDNKLVMEIIFDDTGFTQTRHKL